MISPGRSSHPFFLCASRSGLQWGCSLGPRKNGPLLRSFRRCAVERPATDGIGPACQSYGGPLYRSAPASSTAGSHCSHPKSALIPSPLPLSCAFSLANALPPPIENPESVIAFTRSGPEKFIERLLDQFPVDARRGDDSFDRYIPLIGRPVRETSSRGGTRLGRALPAWG